MKSTYLKAATPESKRQSPEENLLMAVLIRAVHDCIKVTKIPHTTETDIMEAMDWIVSTEKSPMSFNWITEQLNLPTKKIRKIVVKACEEKEAHQKLDKGCRRIRSTIFWVEQKGLGKPRGPRKRLPTE